MPTYSYECRKCGRVQDEFHSITANPRVKCKKCGGACKRKLGTGSGIIFKGTGFYETDYKRAGVRGSDGKLEPKSGEGKSESTSSEKSSESMSESKSESKTETKTESKPEPKPDPTRASKSASKSKGSGKSSGGKKTK